MITDEELQTIQKIANRVYRKYIFGYFDADDIKQQAILIGIKAVEEEWDRVRPLENFLAIHIPNRLKNFKRDNYFRLDISEDNEKRYNSNNTKKKLMETSELFEVDLTDIFSPLEEMSKNEIINSLKEKMSPQLLSDFNRLLNGVILPKERKEALYNFVKDNINENW